MNHFSPNLDYDKFGKIVAMMVRGATDGERAAARNLAVSMVERAGLNLTTALNILNNRLGNTYCWDDLMEAAFPGWKAEKARIQAEEHAEKAKRRAEVLNRYGSEEALFARCKREHLLAKAVEPIATYATWTDDNGVKHRYADRLDGVKPRFSGSWYLDELTPKTRDALVGAFPFPSTLSHALDELVFWDGLRRDRELILGQEWSHHAEVEARIEIVTDMIRNKPVASWDDLAARFRWHRWDWAGTWIERSDEGYAEQFPEIARLQADIDTLRRQAGGRARRRIDNRQLDLFC